MQSTSRVVSPLREQAARLRCRRAVGLSVVISPAAAADDDDDTFLPLLDDDEACLDRDLDLCRVAERNSGGPSCSPDVQSKPVSPWSSETSDLDDRRAVTVADSRTLSSSDNTATFITATHLSYST